MERKTGEGNFSLFAAMNGCLAGLVGITGGCAVVEPWAAVIIGSVSGLLYLLSSKLLVRLRIDDAVDAVPVHMTNGVWGTIAVGLFATSEKILLAYGEAKDEGVFMGGNGTLLGCQLISILFVQGWVTVCLLPFFCLLNYLGWFRTSSTDEVEGLDRRYHGASPQVKNQDFDATIDSEMCGRSHKRLRRSLDLLAEGPNIQIQQYHRSTSANTSILTGKL